MSLTHCILHHIERATPGGPVTLGLRDKENQSTGNCFSLFEQLKQAFQRSGLKQYGTFDPARSDNPVPGLIRDQLDGRQSFAAMSHRVLKHLQAAMEKHQEPFSAHILIGMDRVMEQNQCYLFWINHIEANCIDSDLDVAITRYIDSTRLQFGWRLFVDEWLQRETPKYLAMVASRGNKILTDAFSDFVGFSTGLDLVEDTHEFLQIVDDYMDTLAPEQTADVKGKIVDYCVDQDKVGAPIVFDELSSQLDESAPEKFAHFVSHRQQDPKTEIYADRGSLKRYMRFFGRDNTMSISFSSDLFGEDVVYDEKLETLTLKRIPKSLKQQLREQLKGGSQSN